MDCCPANTSPDSYCACLARSAGVVALEWFRSFVGSTQQMMRSRMLSKVVFRGRLCRALQRVISQSPMENSPLAWAVKLPWLLRLVRD
jgi:hypothetical protein